MNSLLLYLLMLALGCLVGTKFMDREKSYPWVGKLQFVAIIVLIFTMGIRIGADERVIASLKEIGMYSLVLTIFAMVGSILFVFLARKILKLNKEGMRSND